MNRRSPMPPRRTRLTGSPEKHWEWQDRIRQRAVSRRRETVLKRAPQIRPVERDKSRGTSSQPGESRARRLVRARSGGLCEMRMPGLCTWWATEFSHRIRRSQGGPWTASNGLDSCHWCHLAITNTNGRRAEYRAKRWVLDSTDNPLTEPALTIHGLVLLNDHGDFEQVDDTTTPRGNAA